MNTSTATAISDWQWFLPVGGLMATFAVVLVTRRAYWPSRAVFLLSSLAVGYPAFGLHTAPRVGALLILTALFCTEMWYVRKQENPIVATLTVGPAQVWRQVEQKSFGVWVELQVGSEAIGVRPDWVLRVMKADQSISLVCRKPAVHGGISGIAGASLNPEMNFKGFLTTTYDRSFPNGEALRGARFTVSVSATRGRILPASYTVTGLRFE